MSNYFNKNFKIEDKWIGDDHEPFIIAEMSANHGNDINIAIEIIKEAKKAGADAIKIQTYTADTLTIDCKEKAFEAKGAWEGVYLYDLYKEASMPWEWTPKLQEIAKKEGIILFSSPFDFSSIEFLESLNMPVYKIASPEIVDLPFIRRITQTKKPIIMSTGNATLSQINDAVEVMIEENIRDLVILKCTSEYPAPPENINLKTIQNLKEIFKCPVGLSDHTLGSAIPISSVALGASVIEKHFIVDRTKKTADSFFSATPEELKAIVDGSKMVKKAIGEISYPIISNRDQRSLIVVEDIKKDDIFTSKNIRSIRPGGGMKSSDIDKVLNRVASKELKKGTLLQWDMLGKLSD
ncbi:pseudaminic acid synthase [Aliarcobacter lanthieri]|uniref:pseudaminic acid synthase n=1 Tax=Aliarcobacter lanthieri TaxID=1355374 RepID=UPI003AA81E1F